MDTNKLLTEAGWRGHSHFPIIARRAHELATAGACKEDQILRILSQEFSKPVRQIYRTKPIHEPLLIGDDFDPEAVNQLRKAARLPVARKSALMPDGHPGYALPIGGVIALDNAISPSFVGYDIGCKMQLSVLDISPKDFVKECRSLMKILKSCTRFGLGAVREEKDEDDNAVFNSTLWNKHPLDKLKDLARDQLGTSGAGNHFANLMMGKCYHYRTILNFAEGSQFVALLTHSGSRGVGGRVAAYYMKQAQKWCRANTHKVPRGYEYLPLSTELGQEYNLVMKLMMRYASANHDIIHSRFLDATGIELVKTVQSCHNFAWPESPFGVLHRKGAIPASINMLGIIPGTMASPSYLVRGLGSMKHLRSASHGAGRICSRTESVERFDEAAHIATMQQLGIMAEGVAPDESYQAYRDISKVIAKQEGHSIETLAVMRPKVVIMGGRDELCTL